MDVHTLLKGKRWEETEQERAQIEDQENRQGISQIRV
jgi:hypothetical protein